MMWNKGRIILVIVVVAFITILSAGCIGVNTEKTSVLDQINIEGKKISSNLWTFNGDQLIYTGKYEKAIQNFDKAIEVDSHNSGPYFSKGLALTELGRHEEALQAYDKAIEIDPGDKRAWNGKGLALTNLGRYEEALQAYDKLTALDSKILFLWSSRGLATYELSPQLYQSGHNQSDVPTEIENYEEALQAYNKAIEHDPNNMIALNSKGVILNELGRHEEALQAINKAIEIDHGRPKGIFSNKRLNSEIPKAWYNKGCALTNLGRYEEAIEALDKAIDLDPQYANAWYSKGTVLDELSRHDEAQVCYDKAKELGYGWY